jgi:hypothetical protein
MIPRRMSSSLPTAARLLMLYTDISAVSVESTFTVTDYGAENPLLYDVSLVTACSSGCTSPRLSQSYTDDRSFRYHPSFIITLIRPATQYYGFSESFYDFTYRSRGDPELSRLVVDTFESIDLSARLTPATESRGRDGRPQRNRPAGFVEAGLDHGVFIPFKRMFPDKGGKSFEIPIVEVSMSQDLSPDPQWELGAALKSLREQGILILAGGLTVHDFGDFTSFDQARAKPVSRGILDKAIIN